MADECIAATITNILSHMVLSRTCQRTLWLGKYVCRPGVRTNCFAGCLCQMRSVANQQKCTMAWAGGVDKYKFWVCCFQRRRVKIVVTAEGQQIIWPEWKRQVVSVFVAPQFLEDKKKQYSFLSVATMQLNVVFYYISCEHTAYK